jgi:hypothetical protein
MTNLSTNSIQNCKTVISWVWKDPDPIIVKNYVTDRIRIPVSLQKTGICRIMCEVRVPSTVLPVRERKTKPSAKNHNCCTIIRVSMQRSADMPALLPLLAVCRL